MPKSRVRKKKTKKKGKKIKQKSFTKNNKQVIFKDGIEITREGKNIYFKNKRTSEEHALFLEKLKRNRPELLAQIEKKIEQVVHGFSTLDKIIILGVINAYYIENLRLNSTETFWEPTLEYALSFASAIKENSSIEPDENQVTQIIDNLISIRELYKDYILSEHVEGKFTEVESSIRFKTITEALYVRGDGYKQHVYEIYNELFSGHDAFLQQHYGFNSKDILEVILQLEESFFCRVAFSDGRPAPQAYNRFKEWADSKSEREIAKTGKHFMSIFSDENPDIIVEDGRMTAYLLNDTSRYYSLYKVRPRYKMHEAIIDKLSIICGENLDFLDPRFKGLPLNDSLSNLKPILKINNVYYHFAFSLPTRNLIGIVESLIATGSKEYYESKYLGNAFSASRDNYLEKKVLELFRKLIPGAKTFPNVKYRPLDQSGNRFETELDLLLISGEANYLIEMKAGGLNSPARRGALKSLKGQLGEIVGYGAYQSFRALKFLKESAEPNFYSEDGSEVLVNPQNRTFRITITFEHLANFVTDMYDLKELGVINEGIDFSWTISVYDLLIFAEILETELDLIEFLQKRLPLYERSELHFSDEIDLLGHFLSDNLEFDEKLIAKLDSFQINNFSKDIDDYFERGATKPTRKK